MEMDKATVEFYIRQIQEKLPEGGIFYCLNRYEKKTRLKDYPFDERWRVVRSEPWPRFIDENPHHEIVAVRTAQLVERGLRELTSSFPPYDSLLERLWAKLQRPSGSFR